MYNEMNKLNNVCNEMFILTNECIIKMYILTNECIMKCLYWLMNV